MWNAFCDFEMSFLHFFSPSNFPVRVSCMDYEDDVGPSESPVPIPLTTELDHYDGPPLSPRSEKYRLKRIYLQQKFDYIHLVRWRFNCFLSKAYLLEQIKSLKLIGNTGAFSIPTQPFPLPLSR